MALTNTAGIAQLSAKDIIREFEYNQELFPMDYKFHLDECDSEARIVVPGGRSFLEAKRVALESPFILPRFRALWLRAQNEELPSASETLDLAALDSHFAAVRMFVTFGSK